MGRMNPKLRPVVVIAGWLGCQPKALTKYASIYEAMGFHVWIRIATPPMVILPPAFSPSSFDKAAVSKTADATVAANATKSCKRKRPSTIQDLALTTIEELQITSCSAILMHVFSNGGCFLWEAMCHLLHHHHQQEQRQRQKQQQQQQQQQQQDNIHSKYSNLIEKFKGIIYDSAPAYFAHTNHYNNNLTYEALKYCTIMEQLQLKSQLFMEEIMIGYKERIHQRQKRAVEYWYTMKGHPLLRHIPSLYLFSKSDDLTPFEPLLSLVKYRKKKFGRDDNDHIKFVVFENSPHCRHVLTHPDLYISSVNEFVQKHINRTFTTNPKELMHHRSRL